MRPAPKHSALLLLGLILSAACGDRAPQADEASSAPASAPAVAPAAPSLATAAALGVVNAHEPTAGLITAGQLTQAQLQAMADAGYVNFISLRSPTEQGAGWEEAFASANGIAFSRVTVTGAGDLTRANVEALDAILDAAGDAPTVLYCASSNRVGAMLALRAHWLDGASADAAIALGRAAGMTSLEPAVVEILGR